MPPPGDALPSTPESGRVPSRTAPPAPRRRHVRSARFELRPRPRSGRTVTAAASMGTVNVRPGVPVVATVPTSSSTAVLTTNRTQRRRGSGHGDRVHVTRSRSRAASSPGMESPPPQRRNRPAVNYYEGDNTSTTSSSTDNDYDPEDVGDDILVLLRNADGTPCFTRFVSPDVVPPQDRDMSSECGGKWLTSAPGEWRLVDNLGEMELLTVQMRLGELERRPSPVQQQLEPQRKRQHSSSSASSGGPRTLVTCRVCMDAVVEVVLVTCGHLCICSDCYAELMHHSRTGNLVKCPVCRVVGGAVRIFM